MMKNMTPDGTAPAPRKNPTRSDRTLSNIISQRAHRRDHRRRAVGLLKVLRRRPACSGDAANAHRRQSYWAVHINLTLVKNDDGPCSSGAASRAQRDQPHEGSGRRHQSASTVTAFNADGLRFLHFSTSRGRDWKTHMTSDNNPAPTLSAEPHQHVIIFFPCDAALITLAPRRMYRQCCGASSRHGIVPVLRFVIPSDCAIAWPTDALMLHRRRLFSTVASAGN
jgi:hypothetical protein